MIPMQMREINVVGVLFPDFLAVDFREIPPAAPVTRTDEPRIEKQCFAFVFDEHSGVAYTLNFINRFLFGCLFAIFLLIFAYLTAFPRRASLKVFFPARRAKRRFLLAHPRVSGFSARII
jgi:hypothetical protein